MVCHYGCKFTVIALPKCVHGPFILCKISRLLLSTKVCVDSLYQDNSLEISSVELLETWVLKAVVFYCTTPVHEQSIMLAPWKCNYAIVFFSFITTNKGVHCNVVKHLPQIVIWWSRTHAVTSLATPGWCFYPILIEQWLRVLSQFVICSKMPPFRCKPVIQ